MSTFKDYVSTVAELTHSVAYIDYSVEDDAEEATIYSDDDHTALIVTDRMPWGDMLQDYTNHVLH